MDAVAGKSDPFLIGCARSEDHYSGRPFVGSGVLIKPLDAHIIVFGPFHLNLLSKNHLIQKLYINIDEYSSL